MARRVRSKPIVNDVTADEQPLTDRSGGGSTEEDNLDVKKSEFIKTVNNMGAVSQNDFLREKLMCNGDTLDELKQDFIDNINTEKALNFAKSELDDYIDGQGDTTPLDDAFSESDAEMGEDDDTSEEPTSPMFEEMEDFSEDEFKSTIKGVSGFVRESFKKSIDMLNDILTRLKRVEEKTDLHSENLKVLGNQQKLDHDAIKDMQSQVTSLREHRPSTSSDAPPRSFSVTLPDRPEPIEVEGTFPKEWDYMCKLSQARVNQLWVGPTGCGKSYLVEKMADTLGLPFYSVSCTEGMSESEFKGWLLPLGDNMKFTYLPSGFVTAYEKGGVFNADEWDGVDPNVGIWVNKALAGNSFYLPLREGNHLVKRHKDFVWIACGNTLGTGADMVYTGRNQLDGSTLDRHMNGLVTLDYDPMVEKSIVDKHIYLWAMYMRTAMADLQIVGHPLSTRFLETETLLKNMYPEDFSVERLQEKFLLNWDKDGIRRVKQVMGELISKELEK